MSKKRKILCPLALIVALLILLTSCDPYSGKRPDDLGNAKWISESPDIWFQVTLPVPDRTKSIQYVDVRGEANVDGEKKSFFVRFSYKGINFLDRPEEDLKNKILLSGVCKFGSEELVVKIDHDMKDEIFHGIVDEITFVKVPVNE